MRIKKLYYNFKLKKKKKNNIIETYLDLDAIEKMSFSVGCCLGLADNYFLFFTFIKNTFLIWL